MDTPQVQVPGPDNPDSNAQNAASNPNPNPNASTNPNPGTKVEMGGTQEAVNATEPATEDTTLPDAQPEPEPPTPAKKNPFNILDFLTSPIVEIVVDQGEDKTVLTAHQTLLLESPFLSDFVGKFDASGPRRIRLPEENVEAFGCFLQFQYTRDYTIPVPETPTITQTSGTGTDESGHQLLRHARIYTLAEKLRLPALKSLAHTKIHRVNSTPSGELSYARYVYTHTPADDTTIRRPVASYWATRSHALCHEVGDEFKKLCIEVPEFSYDVLTIILDRKEKSNQSEAEAGAKGSARKRLRSDK